MAQDPVPDYPKQAIRVGVAGYKMPAETGERVGPAPAETSTPLLGGTLGAEIRPVGAPPAEVAPESTPEPVAAAAPEPPADVAPDAAPAAPAAD